MKSIHLALGLVCLLAVSLAAQSLGDVAKKAEAERQVQKAPSKTYTDKDLKDAGTAVTPAPTVVATSATSARSEADRKDEYRTVARKDEASWKERMRTLQAALDGDQIFLAAAIARERELAKRANRSEGDVLYIREGRLRTEVNSQWEEAVTEVSRLKAAVEVDRQAIITLQEEARRANVPPGWLRP